MGKLKDYIWIVPLIGGILTLGAFFAPALYMTESNESIYLWMWALVSIQYESYYGGTERDVVFSRNPDILTPSIICSFIIILCILTLIISSFLYRKRMRNSKVNPIVGLGASICIIGFNIAWIVIIEAVMSSYLSNFWSYMNPGFGVIGMFIGPVLSIIGYGGAIIGVKQKREIIHPLQERRVVTEVHDPTTATTPQISKFKFCSECGTKLSKVNQKFCMECGTRI